ncbi:MAG TPA: hypothetical protein DIU39_07635 [Flavobacteriales bacterium]|nr:hypothetical protein [Flavobacteriales bacterium]|tara:strand:- start:93427 stop:95118 length:1692 start_codon:yes stop_codon:yes gene_type:complete
MKKIVLSAILFAALSLNSLAQSPEGFKYQAVVRDASQNVLPNQAVGVQITILQGSATGTVVYQETFSSTTNGYGLINLAIGNGTVVSGTFSTIDWSAGPYFIETAIDAAGGTNYAVMGTSQLLSVPYALYSKTAENVINDNVNDADADPTNEYNMSVALSGTNLQVTDGGGTITTDLSSLQDGVNDADADSTNELQTLSFSNDSLLLSNGGSVFLGGYANLWDTVGANIYNINSGNVGIGTTSPNYALNLHTSVNTYIQFTNNSTGTTPNDGLLLGNNSLNDAYLIQREAANLFIRTNNMDRITINGNGNVGIGTTSPTTLLHVVGNNNSVIVEDAGNGRQLSFYGNGEIESSTGATLYLNRFSNSNIRLAVGGGNVGIGTTAPVSKLQVENNIATGGLDNFSEYQILLYQGTNAVNSYGFGVRSNTLIYNSKYFHDFDIQGVTSVRIDTNGIVQEPWQNVTLQNGWINYGTGYAAPQFYKDKEGVIHVKGLIQNGTTAPGTVLFNLPLGYRPSERRIVQTTTGGTSTPYGIASRVDILPNGDVIIQHTNIVTWINLEFSFRP